MSLRVNVPIQHLSTSSGTNSNDQRLQERIRRPDTTVQWVNDPVTGAERFRVNINIDGFSQGEVNAHVEGNKLVVYGEHEEIKQQSKTKKIIEKSFELPKDVDKANLQVTYPTSTLMLIDFPSRHSNVIIDDGRLSSKLVTNYDNSIRPLPRNTHERSSSEYTSTRKIGGGGGNSVGYERSSTPRTYPYYDSLFNDTNTSRNNNFSTTSHYRSRESESPARRPYVSTTTTDTSINSIRPTYEFRVNADDSQLRRTNPITIGNENGNSYEKTYTETRRETHHRRSSPTTGLQSSHEFDHRRSGSPSLARSFDEDRFRTGLTLGNNSYIQRPSSSHNVEEREFTRRIGNNGAGNNNERSLFSHDFNADAFYRSAFRPQVFTDDRGRNCIEMKLDVSNYQPNEIKVSINGNDLVVRAEHNDDRPPKSSTRAYFYKQISLPPNTDPNTLSSEYHPDGSLHITAKLSNPQASIRHN